MPSRGEAGLGVNGWESVSAILMILMSGSWAKTSVYWASDRNWCGVRSLRITTPASAATLVSRRNGGRSTQPLHAHYAIPSPLTAFRRIHPAAASAVARKAHWLFYKVRSGRDANSRSNKRCSTSSGKCLPGSPMLPKTRCWSFWSTWRPGRLWNSAPFFPNLGKKLPGSQYMRLEPDGLDKQAWQLRSPATVRGQGRRSSLCCC